MTEIGRLFARFWDPGGNFVASAVLSPFGLTGFEREISLYSGWRVKVHVEAPDVKVSSPELGYLHRIRSAADGAWGSQRTSGHASVQTRVYVGWLKGSDVGSFWVGLHSCLACLAYGLPAGVPWFYVLTAAALTDIGTQGYIGIVDCVVCFSGCPVRLLVLEGLFCESGWR